MKNKINPVWAETMTLYNAGLTVTEISERLGVNVDIITNRIKESKKIENKKEEK